MVTDTASMSATKRNGLLIFSIQKNKYLYWDSVGSKWAEMAGTAGSAITGSGVAGYMPEFTTATNIDTTRLYHSNGRFAIGSTTTTNGVFNVIGGTTYLEGNLSFGAADRTISNISNNVLAFGTNNTERMRLKADGEVLIGTTTDVGAFVLQLNGSAYTNAGYWTGSSGQLGIGVTSSSYPMEIIKDGNSIGIGNSIISIRGSGGDDQRLHFGYNGSNVSLIAAARTLAFTRYDLVADGWRESMRINNTGELLIGSTSDAGTYALQVTGAIYNTTTITTGAPSGGTAKPFKIGAAATVSPTSPNRTIEIEIDGTTYYIHAKTTND